VALETSRCKGHTVAQDRCEITLVGNLSGYFTMQTKIAAGATQRTPHPPTCDISDSKVPGLVFIS
jgi:hypothetical protein